MDRTVIQVIMFSIPFILYRWTLPRSLRYINSSRFKGHPFPSMISLLKFLHYLKRLTPTQNLKYLVEYETHSYSPTRNFSSSYLSQALRVSTHACSWCPTLFWVSGIKDSILVSRTVLIRVTRNSVLPPRHNSSLLLDLEDKTREGTTRYLTFFIIRKPWLHLYVSKFFVKIVHFTKDLTPLDRDPSCLN